MTDIELHLPSAPDRSSDDPDRQKSMQPSDRAVDRAVDRFADWPANWPADRPNPVLTQTPVELPDPFRGVPVSERSSVAPFERDGRLWFWGDDQSPWSVREIACAARIGWPGSERALWFEGQSVGRLVRGYPRGWASLSRADLVALTHER